MDFIEKLYSYDNFTLILTVVLIVLVILFVLVLFLGKKDEKLQETKRLQKIELEKTKALELNVEESANAFKETSTKEMIEVKEELPQVLEDENSKVESLKEEEKLNPILPNEETMLIPNLSQMVEEDIKTEVKDPVVSITSEETKELEQTNSFNDIAVTMTIYEPKETEPEEEILEELTPSKPLLAKETEEEQMPISVEDIASFQFDMLDEKIEQDLTTLKSITSEFNRIEIPEANPEIKIEKTSDDTKPVEEKYERAEWPLKEEKKPFAPSQVFSSVFVENEPQNKLPKIKEDETVKAYDDADDFELPTLKSTVDNSIKEEKISTPKKENMFSFDDLVG